MMGKLTPASEILKVEKPARQLSPIEQRLINSGPRESAILYQHSVLCQTSMPYRDPHEQRSWTRRNGVVSIKIDGGNYYDGRTDEWKPAGLPFGPKPRLALFHLNAEAVRKQSACIELEHSLTAFTRRLFGADPGGRTIRAVRDQLTRLAAADFRFGMRVDERSVTLKSGVIDGLELWTPRDENQCTLWPTVIRFSDLYFNSLMAHAVPLNEVAISGLSHNAMALDAYTWLAQRLHRIGVPLTISWKALKEQFGEGYGRVIDFRRVFVRTLKMVKVVYPEARIEVVEGGLQLSNSPAPVIRSGMVVL